MRIIISCIVLIIICLYCPGVFAQGQTSTSAVGSWQNKPDKNITLFGSLNHQHQNFFKKAFSYQGAEIGLLIDDKVRTSVFFSSFVSNLEVKIANKPMFVTSWKSGFSVGRTYNAKKTFHIGWQVSTGYFSLQTGDQKLAIFSARDSQYQIRGLIVDPEIYTELNVASWFRLRTGLTYSYHFYTPNTFVSGTELNTLTMNFGFVFIK